MRKTRHADIFSNILYCSVVLLSLSSGSAQAQVHWLQREHEFSVTLEAAHSDFKTADDFSLLNSVWIATIQYPLNPQVMLMFDLPYARYDVKNTADNLKDQDLFGNPFLGIGIHRPRGNSRLTALVEMGVRLPLAPDRNFPATFVGMYTRFDRFEAFVPKLWTMTFNAKGIYHYEPVAYSFTLGATHLMPEFSVEESASFFDYYADFWYQRKLLGFWGGFRGRTNFVNEELNYGHLSVHLLGFAVSWDIESTRTAFTIWIPLENDHSALVNVVYGLSITAKFG